MVSQLNFSELSRESQRAQFFKGKPTLAAANHTFLTLINKTPQATYMADFRPISFVNMIYKLLSKLVADRMSKITPKLISPHQTTFIQGKVISDNTILVDEMVHRFGRIRTPKRFFLSIDLRMAFYTVRWSAIIGS